MRRSVIAALALLLFSFSQHTAFARNLTVIASLPAGPQTADGGIAISASNNIYGFLATGNNSDKFGAVYEIPAKAAPGSSATIIYQFMNQADGTYPFGIPVVDKYGNVFGTTLDGALFGLSRPANGVGPWTFQSLYQTKNYLGWNLLLGNGGELYAVERDQFHSIAFRMIPPTKRGGAWAREVFFDSGSNENGKPALGMNYIDVMDGQGNLFGSGADGNGNPCIYKLNAPTQGGMVWTSEVIYSVSDRYAVFDRLIIDKKGNIFTVLLNQGRVIQVSPPLDLAAAWTTKIIRTFDLAIGGRGPTGLAQDANGRLFGTSGGGSTGTRIDNGGDFWVLTPPSSPAGEWGFKNLLGFTSPDNGKGYTPAFGVQRSSVNNLYIVTGEGGANGKGAVLKISP